MPVIAWYPITAEAPGMRMCSRARDKQALSATSPHISDYVLREVKNAKGLTLRLYIPKTPK